MSVFFLFFLLSGFCSILYEIIWLRLAMAQFGVTSALASIVLSSFMAGLGLGSWGSGRFLRNRGNRIGRSALRLYALTEVLIGVSALLVPVELRWGRILLERTGWSSSAAYYVGSGVWIALTMIPWCACMGATIPLAMEAIRNRFSGSSSRSFSYLYMANVLGALAGANLPPLLVELYGFHGTLKIGALLNGVIAASAFAVSLRASPEPTRAADAIASALPENRRIIESMSRWPLVLLFASGLASMGMEVVWIRQFTPYIGTMVYSFAAILAVYLGATFAGSFFYRHWSRRRHREGIWVWAWLGFFGLLPLLATSSQVHLRAAPRLLLGIAPFSALLGFVTPMLVDRWAVGDPDRAGRAYAVNVVGCILGPLLAGFLLLPVMGERWSLMMFALPWLLGGMLVQPQSQAADKGILSPRQSWIRYAVIPLALVLVLTTKGYEEQYARRQVLRDNTATVIAMGEGMDRHLLVNGVGITYLTPITKIMAHLPLAFLGHPPQNVLVVCFGMGTTYRSMLSWGVPTTAVDLVPSVPKLFWYFHADAPELQRSPLSKIVIDDGRRYLERTSDMYDVIALDPPPPVEAAGSSLLYSKEFYATAKTRLRSDGILQQWLPRGDATLTASVARALQESFLYVRAFRSIEGWGTHFLASDQPLPNWTAVQLVQHMPAAAQKDLMEWGPEATPEDELGAVLHNELSPTSMIAGDPLAPALQDDRPINEYFKLRMRRSRSAAHEDAEGSD